MTGGVVKVISAEEIERMPVEELHQEIVNALNTDDSKLDINFKSKKRAEYLERALYYCPNCGSLKLSSAKIVIWKFDMKKILSFLM